MIWSDSPLNGESGDSWFLCKYISSDPLDDGLSGRFGIQLLAIVFIVDVVSDSDEFAGVVGAGEEDDGHA